MSTFISTFTQDILKKHSDFQNVKIILPNQRACVFVRNSFIEQVSKTTFLPKISSIQDFVAEISGLQMLDNTVLLFELYSVYQKIVPAKSLQNFEIFSNWANTVLSDFNEIDAALLDGSQLFTNLRNLKRIEQWFPDENPSELSKNYLHFFEVLSQLYHEFTNQLRTQKKGYAGMLYRDAVKNLSEYKSSNTQHIFAGFNALTKAEETLFQELLNSNLATVYWDIDTAMMDVKNEAGHFLRKYKNEWNYYEKNPFNFIQSEIEENAIEIVGVPKNITQAKYVGSLLGEHPKTIKTAWVLADENLLSVAISSIPDEVNRLNITMGYPLKNIPISDFFEQLFTLYSHQEQLEDAQADAFYYKDVLNILCLPIVSKLCGAFSNQLIREINKQNGLYIYREDIRKNIDLENPKGKNLYALFQKITDADALIAHCVTITHQLKAVVHGIEKEYVYRFYKIFNQLKHLQATYKHITSIKSLQQFFYQLLKNEKLSFQGEPTVGIQLMGVLETRLLDFENLFITGLNEKIFPKSSSKNSFIPVTIRREVGLLTHYEQDVIFSYHFQRLLMRSKKTVLIYNTETDGYGSGEESRFLKQLRFRNSSVKSKLIKLNYPSLRDNPLVINKTSDVIEAIENLFYKGISPSALGTYLRDPFLFYQNYILRIRQHNQVEKNIAYNTMGSVIHDALEELYKPYLRKVMIKEDVDAMLKKSTEVIKQGYQKHYPGGSIQKGKNKLVFEICKKYIQNFLQKEKELVTHNQLEIIALEEPLTTEIFIENSSKPVTIKGIVDRIDRLDGTLRIIDYKTGTVEKSQLTIPSNFETLIEDEKKEKALQVLIYAFLYASNFEASQGIEAGIIPLKTDYDLLKLNLFYSKDYRETTLKEEHLTSFVEILKQLLSRILNPSTPFELSK